MIGTNFTVESRKRITYVSHTEIFFHFKPRRKQIFIRDKISNLLLYEINRFSIVFCYGFEFFIRYSVVFQMTYLFI